MLASHKPVNLLTYSILIIAAFIIILNYTSIASAASAPSVVWDRNFSDSTGDVYIHSAWQTSDGGYILAGSGRDPSLSTVHAYLIKTDANGNKQWDKYYDKYNGMAYSVQQTSDGGYIFSGDAGGAGTGFMVKTDASGIVQWENKNPGWGILYSIVQSADGGYTATGPVVVVGKGDDANVLLVKADANGNIVWEQHFDYSQTSTGYCVWPTSDGGYVIAGDVDEGDGWMGKTDANGVMQWDQWFNDTGALTAVQQTRDGGYILTGKNAFQLYAIKTDSTGKQQWVYNKAGGAAFSVQQTWDDGYVIGCHPGSTYNITVIKLDNSGKEQWTKALDYQEYSLADAGSVQQIGNGNFILGWSASNGNVRNGVLINLSSDMTPVPNAQFVSDTIPSVMEAGSSTTASVTFLNTGTKPWTFQDNTTLGFAPGFDGGKFGYTKNQTVQIATIVRPGQSYTFSFPMTAPAMNGTYYPKFQMVWENHQMFGATDDKAVQVVNGTPDTNVNKVTPAPTSGSTAIVSSNPAVSATPVPSAGAATSTTKTSSIPCLSSMVLPLLVIGTVALGMHKRKK